MSSINLKIDKERNVMQSFYNDKWNDLDNNTNVTSKALANHLSVIKDKYRDHADHLNGSMNYVSPLLKYFGWYAPAAPHLNTKSDDVAQGKRYYQPTLHRWIGDSSLSIETISATADAKIGKGTSRKAYPYLTEANLVNKQLLDSGMTWKHKISGEEIVYSAGSFKIFNNQKVISTGLFHRNVPGFMLNTGHEVDIIAVQINWNYLPEGSYIRFAVSKHNTAPKTFRLLVQHSKSTSAKVGDALYGGWANNIKTLDLYDETENKYYYEGMDLKGKITKDGDNPYTTIILESRGNGAKNDTMQGMLFNVYIPEEYYYECTKGLNETHFLWIKDASSLGKANNSVTAWTEYTYIPSFPKVGDTLRVIDTLDVAPGSPDIKYDDYLCTTGCMWEASHYSSTVVNPSEHIHVDTLRYSYPVGNRNSISPEFLDYYFNKDDKRDGYFTRYKRMTPELKHPENTNKDTKLYPIVYNSESLEAMEERINRFKDTAGNFIYKGANMPYSETYPVNNYNGITFRGYVNSSYVIIVPTDTLRLIPSVPKDIFNRGVIYKVNGTNQVRSIGSARIGLVSLFGDLPNSYNHQNSLCALTLPSKGQTLFPDYDPNGDITVIMIETIE